MKKDRLITPGYCLILGSNFLLYFGFYLLMPVLPFYLGEQFNASDAVAGVILAIYTIAALTIRPFSGYLLDTLSRKPLWIISYFIFTAIFAGYLVAGTLTAFTIMRVVHGFSFGTVTVSGNTVVIDIMPSSRRGEGLGYYGLAGNIAMAVGPMTGLFLHDYYSFDTIFACALVSCTAGLVLSSCVKAPPKAPANCEPLSLDRFFMLKGIPAGISLLLLSIPYGMTTTYVAKYASQIGITSGTGLFFTLMATGTAISRMFAGRQVDRGRIVWLITWGMCLVSLCFFAFAACELLMEWNEYVSQYIFFGIAIFLGLGFGAMFPAFNTLFVNLARHNQRGTATSTYLTSWDVGIGIGLVFGGYMAQISSYATAYFMGACLAVLSGVVFKFYVGPHFERNKLR